jgi:ubiquinone biosynthesis protein COQ9
MSGDQPLADTIEQLHVYLHVTLDVLLDLENAIRLRDAIVRARAEGNGEAQLKTKRRSITIKAIFLQEEVAVT